MKAENLKVELQLSDIGGGIDDSPVSGLPSNFEEIEVEEVITSTLDEDYFDFKNIVTITGYLNDKIEIVIEWNTDLYKHYKDNDEVKALIKEGQKIIEDSLEHMALIDKF
ncbi:hypothetical protein LCL95_09915 [Bacillus timonensis]|nr:hypothetical protein [Bacillus timonensis]